MPSRLLVPLLAVCTLLAATPGLLWTSARLFERVDDRWLDALGASATTVPLAFAFAALVLVGHGMLTNRAIEATLAEEAAAQRALVAELTAESALVAAAVTAGPGAATATRPSAGRAPRTATVAARRDNGSAAVGGDRPAATPVGTEPAPVDGAAATGPSKASKLTGKGKQAGQRAAKRGARRAKGRGKLAARKQVRSAMRELRR